MAENFVIARATKELRKSTLEMRKSFSLCFLKKDHIKPWFLAVVKAIRPEASTELPPRPPVMRLLVEPACWLLKTVQWTRRPTICSPRFQFNQWLSARHRRVWFRKEDSRSSPSLLHAQIQLLILWIVSGSEYFAWFPFLALWFHVLISILYPIPKHEP